MTLTLPELRTRRVVVAGLGQSGCAAARYLLAHGARVTATDRLPLAALRREAAAIALAGVAFETDDQAAGAFAQAELIVASPGVPLTLPPLAAAIARGVPVISEIDLVAGPLGARSISITGSNGKSTTTALVAAMLGAAGRDAIACANFGVPLCDAAQGDHPQRWYALELSSFQLEITHTLAAAAAILLNVQPDHLDRHGTFERYRAAKWRIAELRAEGAPLVLAVDDPEVAALAPRTRGPIFEVSAQRPVASGGYVEREALVLRVGGDEEVLAELHELPIPGRHNRINILAAAVACRALGVPLEAIRRAVLAFQALPHRLQEAARVGGVRYIDDSKATNVASALEAIRALTGPRLLVLLGGRDKAGDFRPLAAALAEAGARAHTFGEAGDKIADVLSAQGFTALERCTTLASAVHRARALAQPGDIVLLSPACASFDEFTNYAARGDAFAKLARSFAEEGA